MAQNDHFFLFFAVFVAVFPVIGTIIDFRLNNVKYNHTDAFLKIGSLQLSEICNQGPKMAIFDHIGYFFPILMRQQLS